MKRLLYILVVLSLFGCKSTANLTNSHDKTRDSGHTEYVHDSIYIDRWHSVYVKGDTVFIHDSVWRDRWHKSILHDSVYISLTDTIIQTVEVEKKGSAFWKGSGIAFWVLLALVVLAGCVGVIIKFAK